MTLLMALLAFTVEPNHPSTLVYPPYGHCMGIYRAGPEQLNMLLGGLVRFNDPQGLAAVKLSEWDSPDASDDDELAVYGVNSGSGQIIYNASMYTLGYYDGEGSSHDRLSSPHGIAATASGDIYVADTGNGRVAVLSRRGSRIKATGYITGLDEPWGVALDGRGIWVTDRAGGAIYRYASQTDQSPRVTTLDRPRGVAATGYERWTSGHSPFQAVSNEELAKANAAFAVRGKELQALENARALAQGRPPVTIALTNEVRGIVVAKKVDYSIDGLTCDLTLSPGMLDIETPVTSDDIDEGEGGEGQQYPIEDE